MQMQVHRCKYVNCFNKLRFLAESRTTLQKMWTFSDTLTTITQNGNMETRQMATFFSYTFSALTVCTIHFWIWKYSKFIFMWSPFCPFWSVKYLNFCPKLPIRTAHHTFLKSRHPDVTKIYIMFCSPTGAIIHFLGSSSWTI